MFEIRKSAEFSAAHSLRGYDGPCARNHGHNYKLEIVVQGPELDEQKMLMDFYDLDAVLGPLVDKLDHRNINEVPPFTEVNPTAEAVAAWFYGEMKAPIRERTGDRARLAAVHLWETPGACVTYTED